SPRTVTRPRTSFFSSGTQIRCSCRFGTNRRDTFLVTCRPTPPFFLAIPPRGMTLPRGPPQPGVVQTFHMVLKGGRKMWGARYDSCALYARVLPDFVNIIYVW